MNRILSLILTSLLALQSPISAGGGGSAALARTPTTSSCSVTGTHTISDCFVTPQSPISSPWTSIEEPGLVDIMATGTGAKTVTGTDNGIALYTGGTANNDQESTVYISDSSGHNGSALYTGPCVRMDTSGNGYCWLVTLGMVDVLAGGSGKFTVLGDCPPAVDGHFYQLQIAGTTLTCRDLTASTSNSTEVNTYSSGRIGFYVSNLNSSEIQVRQFGGTQ